MKRLFHFNRKLTQIAIIAMLANIRIASGQSEKNQQFPIPENINKIFKTSCMQCHGSDGGRLPKSRLNFARWAGYGATKEAEKALLICSTLRKGKMPPKSVRESNPELILTKEQVDLICKWAESLKSEKEEK
jgi:mono/diheme cytochrome c family protein